jgi:hypothetical protein
MKEKTMLGIFQVSGIEVLNHWKLENKYWPDSYVEDIMASPWWLVKTPFGLIEIGWRKRVISIDWSDTNIDKIVTEDQVTKGDSYVHASSDEQAIKYLKVLADAMLTHRGNDG